MTRPIFQFRNLFRRNAFRSLPWGWNPVFRRFSSLLTPEEGQAALKRARQALLNNVEGFIPRQRLRLRLFLMGQIRPLRLDDVMAITSWVFLGHSLFVLVGTTTFFSVMLFLANSLSVQEYIGTRVSDAITMWTGYNVTFESAIVPRWREGSIRLGNVKIVCNDKTWREIKRAEAALLGIPFNPDDVDVNWTYWDLTVESIDISLSLWRWLDGRGLVKVAKLKGVRGSCDRQHLVYDNWTPALRVPQYGDFELEGFAIEDALITINNPNFRPYDLAIFHATLPVFRMQWMLYDMLCAESAVGTLDDCLFSVHKPQTKDVRLQAELKTNWSKLSNLKLYGIPVEHFNAGLQGPLGWITKGTIDLDLHFLVPHTSDNEDIFDRILDEVDGLRYVAMNKLGSVIKRPDDELSASKKSVRSLKDIRHYGLKHNTSTTPSESVLQLEDTILHDDSSLIDLDPSSRIVILGRVKIQDVKASVPLANESLSYMSNALIRPVVGYMNNNRVSIPLQLSAQTDIDNFNGAWDIYAAGLTDILSEEVGRALMTLVHDEYEQTKRLKQIGLWSVAEVSQKILNIMEHARGDRGWSEYSGENHLSFFW
ncbi:mitochondrial distribution and morphology protein family 31/32 [Globomyces pollinis-pini]|nr:mitochondrial distribution and morphology protein family 31/32 [Globomyces pollinis-pini]